MGGKGGGDGLQRLLLKNGLNPFLGDVLRCAFLLAHESWRCHFFLKNDPMPLFGFHLPSSVPCTREAFARIAVIGPLSLSKIKNTFHITRICIVRFRRIDACGFFHNLIIQQLLIAKHCMPACDGSLYSWTQFANDTDSSIEPQLFEPAFCTDTEVCIAKTDCSNLQITLCDRLSMQIGDFVKDALQQTAKCDHRRFFLQLFLRCVSRNFGRCVHVTGLASEVNILGRVLHRSINQHRSSKHLARIRQLRRLVKQTIALGLDQLLTRTSLLCVRLIILIDAFLPI